MKIVAPEFGKENSKKSEPLVVPFGVNQDGTELLLVAIDKARQAGAAYVGDMEMIVTFRWSGKTVECKTRVVFDGDPALAEKPPEPPRSESGAYTTSIEEYRPRKLSVTARENALLCEEGSVSRVGARKATTNERMDVERSRSQYRESRDTPLEYAVETEKVDRCRKERVERQTERYDYELRLGFIPPDLSYLSKRYGDRELRTTSPVCYQVAQATEPLYRLTATAFYRSKVADRPVTRLASDSIYEDMTTREAPISYEAQVQRCKQMGGKTCETDTFRTSDSGWMKTGGPNEWREKNGPWKAPDEQ